MYCYIDCITQSIQYHLQSARVSRTTWCSKLRYMYLLLSSLCIGHCESISTRNRYLVGNQPSTTWQGFRKNKIISVKKVPPMGNEPGTSCDLLWCLPNWTNLALLVGLKLLRFLYNHALLIWQNYPSPKVNCCVNKSKDKYPWIPHLLS